MKTQEISYESIREFSMNMTEEQETKLKEIIAMVESQSEWINEYHTSNEDNFIAEYVASIGYGGELMYQVTDFLESIKHDGQRYVYHDHARASEVCDYLLALIESNKNAAIDLIRQNSTLDCVDIHYRYWELCSMTIGEIEEQVSDELAEKLAELSPIERAYVERETGLRGDHIYEPMDYDRWVLILDYDAICEVIDQNKGDK